MRESERGGRVSRTLDWAGNVCTQSSHLPFQNNAVPQRPELPCSYQFTKAGETLVAKINLPTAVNNRKLVKDSLAPADDLVLTILQPEQPQVK